MCEWTGTALISDTRKTKMRRERANDRSECMINVKAGGWITGYRFCIDDRGTIWNCAGLDITLFQAERAEIHRVRGKEGKILLRP